MNKKLYIKKLIELKEKKKILEKQIKKLEVELLDDDFETTIVNGYEVKPISRNSFKFKGDIDHLINELTDEDSKKFIKQTVTNLKDLYNLKPNLVEKKVINYITIKKQQEIKQSNEKKIQSQVDYVYKVL